MLRRALPVMSLGPGAAAGLNSTQLPAPRTTFVQEVGGSCVFRSFLLVLLVTYPRPAATKLLSGDMQCCFAAMLATGHTAPACTKPQQATSVSPNRGVTKHALKH
jgi:hypothetical protein